jgi:hypothetical protein
LNGLAVGACCGAPLQQFLGSEKIEDAFVKLIWPLQHCEMADRRGLTIGVHGEADLLPLAGNVIASLKRRPIFELLEARGFTVFLVNARDAKHVPGRKTDVSDAQWLQRLHSHGLLRASFRQAPTRLHDEALLCLLCSIACHRLG